MKDESENALSDSSFILPAFILGFGCVAERRLRQTVDLESPDETDGGSSPSAPMVSATSTMPTVGGWVASPDSYRFDSCRALFEEKREASSEKRILEALTPLARGLVPKTRGPFTGPGRFDSCSFR